MITDTIQRELCKPFLLEEHGFVNDNPYILKSAIRARLDRVVPGKWSIGKTELLYVGETNVVMHGPLTVAGQVHFGVGTGIIQRNKTDKDGVVTPFSEAQIAVQISKAFKTAASDILPRAALNFGMGEYLRDMPKHIKGKEAFTRWYNERFRDTESLNIRENAEDLIRWAREQVITDADVIAALKVERISLATVGKTQAKEIISAYVAEQLKGEQTASGPQPTAKTVQQFQQTEPTNRETTITRIEFKATPGGKPRWCATTTGNIPEARTFSLFAEQKFWLESSGYVIGMGSTSIPVCVRYDGQYWNLDGVTPAPGHALVEQTSIVVVNAGESIYYEDEWFEVLALNAVQDEIVVSVRPTPEEAPFNLRLSCKQRLFVRRRQPEMAGA